MITHIQSGSPAADVPRTRPAGHLGGAPPAVQGPVARQEYRHPSIAASAHDFPGEACQVGQAREFVDAVLRLYAGTSADLLGTAQLLVSETAANAIRHTRSGDPGGRFSVAVYRRPGAVAIEVRDQGTHATEPQRSPTVRPVSPDEEHGRGLALVEALAAAWCTWRVADGRIVSFTLECERA